MNYKVIEVYTSEEIRWHGKPVHEAILQHVRGLKLAARCVVTRGFAGEYENGEISTSMLEVLSYKMPVKIEVILPAAEAAPVLAAVQEMVADGIVGVRDLTVAAHKTRKHLIPRHLLVRDVMTPSPRAATAATPASEVVRMLLSADFNSVPVVDEGNKPVGIITQGDLISRGGMPLRLGLLEQLGQENVDNVLKAMAEKNAQSVMTHPAVVIAEDRPLAEAVNLMLKRGLKRLPVVDAAGKLAGILARVDLFRIITREGPDWKALQARNVLVSEPKFVRDIMRRDTQTVPEAASLEEVMRVIDTNDIQRVAVVDAAGKLLGLISDRDLLRLFLPSDQKVGVWDRLASRLTFTEMGKRHQAVIEQARKRTAGEVMKRELVTVHEDTSIEEAIALMAAKQIKRLPVVDGEGKFKGMVSRDSLLRAALPPAGLDGTA